MRWQRALPRVPRVGQAVEAVVGAPEEDPRGRIPLPARQHHLAREQQLPATDRRTGRGVALDPEHTVAAPCHV